MIFHNSAGCLLRLAAWSATVPSEDVCVTGGMGGICTKLRVVRGQRKLNFQWIDPPPQSPHPDCGARPPAPPEMGLLCPSLPPYREFAGHRVLLEGRRGSRLIAQFRPTAPSHPSMTQPR